MNKCISLLRGINVGGNKIIKMDKLRDIYVSLGYSDVKTYIQSGNVIFLTSEVDNKNIETQISNEIFKVCGFDVKVVVRNVEEFTKIIDECNFINIQSIDTKNLYISVLAEPSLVSDYTKIEKIRQIKESIYITDEAVYIYCPDGYRNTKLNNNFLEKVLKVNITTRNWNSMKEILILAKE